MLDTIHSNYYDICILSYNAFYFVMGTDMENWFKGPTLLLCGVG